MDFTIEDSDSILDDKQASSSHIIDVDDIVCSVDKEHTVFLEDGEFPPDLLTDELNALCEASPFYPDHFQLWAMRAILMNHDVLICAPTGCGKTFVAEFAIQQAVLKGKRAIYTCPVKALANEKFAAFTKKLSPISIGILTGDIKLHPDAQCLIMTTEILRTLLYNKELQLGKDDDGVPITIRIDVEEEVGAVVFDEVHYINDKDRGKVWEESLIRLPNEIPVALLSATLDRGETFAEWVSTVNIKPIHFISSTKRVVPLTHYYYYDTGKEIRNLDKLGSTKRGVKSKKKGGRRAVAGNKKGIRQKGKVSSVLVEKYKGLPKLIEKYGNKFVEIQDAKGTFHSDIYSSLVKLERDCEKVRGHQKSRTFTPKVAILNTFAKKLQQKNLTPALFFVFSRKKCELYAKEIRHYFNNPKEQAEVTRIIHSCLSKLKDPTVISSLGKFHMITELAKKGIAVHHSGLVPIMKEIIEILFAKGLIKLLFATETFAVGVNMPTKTAIFKGLRKYCSSDKFRLLLPHEFIQMSGRAGRRGLDKKGTVIILGNMIKTTSSTQLKSVMCGRSQSIQSKFSYHYPFVLKGLLSGDTGSCSFDMVVSRSLLCKEIHERVHHLEQEYEILSQELETHKFVIQLDILKEYKYLVENKANIKPKKYIKKISKFVSIEGIEEELKQYYKYLKIENDTKRVSEELNYNKTLLAKEKMKVIKFLQICECIQDGIDSNSIEPSHILPKGIIASQINECNSILLSSLITSGAFKGVSAEEMIALLAVFLDTKPFSDDSIVYNPDDLDIPKSVKDRMHELSRWAGYYADQEYALNIEVADEWNLHLSMVSISYHWACGEEFSELAHYLPSFEGNFVRDMLKLYNLSREVIRGAEIVQMDDVVAVAEQIESLIIRDVVSTDSLYLYG